ncbi:MAG: FG-GAP-like repeat-containing protein, partial [Terriglobia bacterium]
MNKKMHQSTRRACIYFMTLTGACLGLILPPDLSAQTTFEKKNVPAAIQLTYPYSLAVGDFNGDGYPDLAVANAGSDPASGQYVNGGVSILVNSPTGFTGVLEEETTGKCTVGVVSADFNGDGKLDLAATNFGSNTISILLGKGNGFFTHTGDLDTPPNPAFLATGDFNGDGKMDLAVSNFGDNSISVFPGKGDGTFGTKLDTAVVKNPLGLVAADFNQDHQLDLAVVGVEDENLMILFGKGNGSFEIKNTYQTAVDPIWLIAMDLNGDGRADLVSSNELSLSMFLNKGDGSFMGKKDYGLLSSGQLEAVVAADLDLDSNPDVVVANQTSGYLTTIPGNGQGGLGSYVGRCILDDGAKPTGIIAGDFNGDQKPDLAVAVSNANLVSVFLNTSSRSTTTVPILLSLAGQNNSFYTSELTLTNRGSSGADVNFTYTAAFGGGNGSGGISLSPRQQMIVPDAISWLRTLNIPIPDSGSRGGT